MPKPPADRKHGTGDRNESHIAELDKNLQDRRDKEKEEGARKAEQDAKRDMGIERP